MPSSKVLAIGGAVVATAAIIGTVAVMRSQQKHNEEDDDVFSAPASNIPQSKKQQQQQQQPALAPKAAPNDSPKSAATVPDAVKKAASESKAAAGEVFAKVESKSPAAKDAIATLLDEALNELKPAPSVVPVAPTVPESKAENKVTKVSAAVDLSGRKSFEHLGIAMKVPDGWEVREELSPIPNVAMVTVWNPEFEDFPNAEVPGAVPVIILSVEDIRSENLNLTEFKERSKDLSMQQMLMMTGGVVQPMIRKDSSVQEGSFRHMLEYAQSMPPFLDLTVINLLEVRNGVAYVFQIMCSPNIMKEYRPLFMQLARDTVVTPMDSSALGFYRVCTGKVAVEIDTTWSWSYPSADGAATSSFLAQFELASSVKKEEITLYEEDKVPATEHMLRSEKTVDGVKIRSAFNGMQEKKTLLYNGYALVVHPRQKAISYLPEACLVRTIKSVVPSSEEPRPKSGATFVTPEYGYRFDVVGGSRVVSTKLGNGTVVYAPQGIPSDPSRAVPPEEQGPTITIRIGKPETDPDCMGSVAEWRRRIEEEAANGSITNIQVVNLKDQECLTFTSKEMQEALPNEKVEVRGKVFIFVRNGVTTLVRWESASGMWRKYERDMDAFLASFNFLKDSA
ncbi:hypothetical protein ABL78_6927 [Leptomonas seymouri]|uniref:Present in the outer mitochondrial membrane proteome 10 n=1 Tax=Leptomonas seymouri TaxID=5684 RepID=A0A0N1HUN6_LEPSE|nr:hypothetical protein ABL78_6927 [Leptomonas seymouri]|eukprot:KPI84018.1 hypothetical protein ABL78_6927 [Leptomonas seymouri]